MKLLWPLEEAFAVRAMIAAIGTKRARVIGRCRSFLEKGKRRAGAGSNWLESSIPTTQSDMMNSVVDKSNNRDPEINQGEGHFSHLCRVCETETNPVRNDWAQHGRR